MYKTYRIISNTYFKGLNRWSGEEYVKRNGSIMEFTDEDVCREFIKNELIPMYNNWSNLMMTFRIQGIK